MGDRFKILIVGYCDTSGVSFSSHTLQIIWVQAFVVFLNVAIVFGVNDFELYANEEKEGLINIKTSLNQMKNEFADLVYIWALVERWMATI